MTARFRELDGLRGIAALAVVVTHFTGAYNTRYPDDPAPIFDFPAGAFGVQLFFLISGFVILISAERARVPSDFVISRVSRLYPAYWVAVIVALVLGAAFRVPDAQVTPLQAALNFTMVQRWFLVPNVNDAFWTLAIEMQFYVLILLLLLVTRSRLTQTLMVRVAVAWSAVAVAVAIWASPSSYGIDPQLVDLPVRIVLNVTLAEFGPLFAFGMLAAYSRRSGRIHRALPFAGAAAVGVSGLLHSWVSAAIVAGICIVFLIVAMRKRSSVLLLPPLLWVGKVSYSLYIIHSIAGWVVIRYTLPFLGRDLAMVAALIVVLLMAWGLNELAEKRGSDAFKRLLLQIRQRYQDRRARGSRHRDGSADESVTPAE